VSGNNGQEHEPPEFKSLGAPGASSVIVAHDADKVVLRFPEPKLWVAFDPNGARNVADAMSAEADYIQRAVTKEQRMQYAAGRLREGLITRVTIMLVSMDKDGRKPVYMAAHVVDQVLQAISDLAAMDPNAR